MPGYSLLNTEFNDFSFQPIGEERMRCCSVSSSALARLGIDPWQEAARLTQLPKELATQRLMSMVEGLPDGRWPPSDSTVIAARLVQLLPSRNNSKVASNSKASLVAANQGSHQMIRSTVIWLIFAVMCGAALMIAANGAPLPGTNHTDTHLTGTIPPPQVPLRGAE